MVQPASKRLVTEASVGAAVATQITTPGSAAATALNATFVRFEDEAGNPLASRSVVIIVSATTGEIIDIVSEV